MRLLTKLSKIAFRLANLCYMFVAEHYFMVVTYECIPAEDPLSMRIPTFCSVSSSYCSTPHQMPSLRSTRSFLHLTNISLKYRYICFHCSILLYTFVVFQVECVWRLLSIMCTVKPHKPLVSLLFYCQWNHCNCTASTQTHCSFNISNSYGPWVILHM